MIAAQGKVEGDCFIVLDAFALPVEGTETRVNAQQEAYEYIIDFAETNKVRLQCSVRELRCLRRHRSQTTASLLSAIVHSHSPVQHGGKRRYSAVRPGVSPVIETP